MSPFEAAIDAEVRAGLPNERARLDEARRVLDYHRLRGGLHAGAGRDRDGCVRQRHPLTRRVADVLASGTYNPGPARLIADDPESDAVLASVYRDAGVDQLLAAADALALLNWFCAVQAFDAGSEALKPVGLRLWDASQLVPYADPADPSRFTAVVTIDRFDRRTRYRLWTAAFVREYLTDKAEGALPTVGRVPRLVAETAHPYGRLPFAFFLDARPTADPLDEPRGSFLADANAAVDRKMARLDDAVEAFHAPRGYVFGAPSDWRPADPRNDVGGLTRVPRVPTDVGDAVVRIEYPTPPLDVAAGWLDVEKTVDAVLDGLGVPRSMYRQEAATTVSGDALEAERRALRDYTNVRRDLFAAWEQDLAAATLAVAGAALGSEAAAAAARDGVNLTLRWPPDPVDARTRAADSADLAEGLASEAMVVQQRFRLGTRAEAVEHLKAVAADRAALAAIVPTAPPEEAAPPPPVPVESTEVLAAL